MLAKLKKTLAIISRLVMTFAKEMVIEGIQERYFWIGITSGCYSTEPKWLQPWLSIPLLQLNAIITWHKCVYLWETRGQDRGSRTTEQNIVKSRKLFVMHHINSHFLPGKGLHSQLCLKCPILSFGCAATTHVPAAQPTKCHTLQHATGPLLKTVLLLLAMDPLEADSSQGRGGTGHLGRGEEQRTQPRWAGVEPVAVIRAGS